MKNSTIYSKSAPAIVKKNSRGLEKIAKNVIIEKTITRSGADSITVTLTMTKTISLTKTIPVCAVGAR